MQRDHSNNRADELRQYIEDMLVSHTTFSQIKMVLTQRYHAAATLRDSVGLFITGESRTGKSRLLEEFAIEYPATRMPNGKIVPVVRAEVPAKPTVKGLSSEILAAFGDPSAEKGSVQDKTRRLINFIKECQTRILIIDEVQHFVDKTNKDSILHHLTDWLKELLNKTNIVIVIAGLPDAEALFARNEQLRGRFNRTMQLPRFNWHDENSRAEFIGLIDGFAELLSDKFKIPELGSDDVAYRFYLATGGLTGYVFNIMRQAAWNVIDEGRMEILIEDIDLAYQLVVNEMDQLKTSPFSRSFDLKDVSAYKHAANIGKRANGLTTNNRYRPRSLGEALS